MIDLVTPASRSTSYAPSSTSPTRQRPPLLPLVITCDPARDTPSVLKNYLAEFHPAMLGLTGTWEQIKQVCKAYRVYFSTPEGVKPGMDYLVDHSIYFYLMGAFPFIPPLLIDSKPPTYPRQRYCSPATIYVAHSNIFKISHRPRRRFHRSHRSATNCRASSQDDSRTYVRLEWGGEEKTMITFGKNKNSDLTFSLPFCV